jgi:hypothetical protein
VIGDRRFVDGLKGGLPSGAPVTQGQIPHAVDGRGGNAFGSSGVDSSRAILDARARAHASVSAASSGVSFTRMTRLVRR